MNRLELTDDHEEALRALIDGALQNVWTALPGVVQEYDARRCTCTVSPAITLTFQPDESGTAEEVRIPDLLDVPVMWPGGGGYLASFPLKKGDNVLLVFAARNIDLWWSRGGVQPQQEHRSHDLSDGFAVPTCFDQRNVPTFLSTDAAELRSVDGEQKVRLADDGITLKNGSTVTALLSRDAVELKAGVGSLKVQGANITVTGNLSVTGDVKAGAVSLTTHIHPSGALVAPPTGGPVTGATGPAR